jgi:hypothetical protein
MTVLCKYWIGEITSCEEKRMTTIVVMTSIPITKSELKKTHNKMEIGLKKVNKKNKSLIFTYVIFQQQTKTLFCSEDLKRSCILRTILVIYNNTKNIEDELRDKLKL